MTYKTIYSLMPDEDSLLSLAPEELAGIVLEHLLSIPPDHKAINRHNFSLPSTYSNYSPNRHEEIAQALMEAWVWLEREGMIAHKPAMTGDWYFITRRGKSAGNQQGTNAYIASALLPKNQLHPVIAQKCSSTFLRGEYDSAVFQAFKELEVAVRIAGRLGPEDYGVDMIRKAFRAKAGPLADQNAPVAEQEALANLMAGAIGSYKNPHSHRHVVLDPQEAAEMIFLASHLMRIVMNRQSQDFV